MALDILEDVLVDGLVVVFCGSAASKVSAARRAYYANPTNQFWRALCSSGLTPRLLAPDEFRAMQEFGLGLTDIAKRHSGNDAELPGDADDASGLRDRIERHRPRVVAFVGKRPAKVALGRNILDYGWQEDTFAGSRVFVLPSPSGAARRYWSLEPWIELAQFVRATPWTPSPRRLADREIPSS